MTRSQSTHEVKARTAHASRATRGNLSLIAAENVRAEPTGYEKTEVMLPIRDGVKLHTLI
jgi:hypothetical protein